MNCCLVTSTFYCHLAQRLNNIFEVLEAEGRGFSLALEQIFVLGISALREIRIFTFRLKISFSQHATFGFFKTSVFIIQLFSNLFLKKPPRFLLKKTKRFASIVFPALRDKRLTLDIHQKLFSEKTSENCSHFFDFWEVFCGGKWGKTGFRVLCVSFGVVLTL